MSVTKRLLLYFRLLWILGLHALFIALLLSKLFRDTGWSWFLVFIPLFVFDGIAVVYWVLYFVSYIANKLDDYEHDWTYVCFPEQKISILVLVFYAVGLPLKIAAEILLCFSLKDSIRFYIPGVLLCALFLEIGGVLLFYSLKPAFWLIQRHR